MKKRRNKHIKKISNEDLTIKTLKIVLLTAVINLLIQLIILVDKLIDKLK